MLPSVLENVVAIMQLVVKERKQHFSVWLQHVQHEDFLCDALRLRQIFINILLNASKFTPEDGRIIFEVEELVLQTPGYAWLRFTFSDTEIGIKPAFLPYLFEAFTREQDSRVDKTEGSGLGMAIIKKLMELFGGTIQVQSRLGEGTTFCVELSLKITTSKMEQAFDCKGLKILVVDNDAVACKYLSKTLEELGADAYADAVNRVSQACASGRDFKMILLDWQMPCMNGVQTARAVREHADAKIPILIACAYDWSNIEDEAVAVGVNVFLQKPLFKSTLCSGIQRYLAGCQSVPEKREGNSLHDKHILLVEDNQLNREIAIELLTTMGAVVETAVDGAVGVEQFCQFGEGYFDLVLMDVQMPNMNGYEATRRIRALSRWDAATVPIIAMTADAFAEDVEAAKRAGMNSRLPKLFRLNSLYKEINKYL